MNTNPKPGAPAPTRPPVAGAALVPPRLPEPPACSPLIQWGVMWTTLLSLSCAQAGPVPGQGTWEATLQARDLDGNAANGVETFHDTVLKVTWLRVTSTTNRQRTDAKAMGLAAAAGLRRNRADKLASE